MEWIEVAAKTVEEAKDSALDQLGVDEADAEFEVLETPKAGLFGRLRSEARVRARVLPATPRPKMDRRDRRRSGPRQSAKPKNTSQTRKGASPPQPRKESDAVSDDATPVDQGEIAATFLSGLLDAFGLPSDVEQRQLDDDTTEIAVHGDGLGLLIGRGGQTLTAVQELTRTVVQRNQPVSQGRIVVDVGGYRQARRSALERFTQTVAEQVKANGVARVLEAMPPADRKVVHDTVNEIPGVVTLSEGEEPRRRVVIAPEETPSS